MQEMFQILPQKVLDVIEEHKISWADLEEIRLRSNQRIEIFYAGSSCLTREICSAADLKNILAVMTQYSIYRLEEEFRQGYLTIRGGHRIGLAGKVLLENGVIKRIRDISSINIRVAKEKVGCVEPLISKLYQSGWKNALFIGPPACGKTTLLRDLTRVMSQGDSKHHIFPIKVGLVDERSEIAGCVSGVPQYQLGPRVDVLDACPKAAGMMMLIRSMSPDVLVVDEIGGEKDVYAVQEAIYAGVKVMASAHGFTYEDFLSRPYMSQLAKLKAFERYVLLSNRKGIGTVEKILNSCMEEIPFSQTAVGSLW